MRKLLAGGVAMLIAGSAWAAPVQEVGERYMKLVLAVGQHDASYVDAYYGPAQLQEQAAKEKLSLAAIRSEAAAARKALPAPGADPDEALRIAFLDKQLQSMLMRVDMLGGKKFSFDEETATMYNAVAPQHDRAYYLELQDRIGKLLGGEGPLAARVQAFRAKVEIPKDKLRPVMEAAIRACRERTAKYITMPAGESFVLEFVQNQPWSGYNWYKGGAHSLIQINTEFPIYIDRAVDLGCHEGYPGHHVYNALLEQTLMKGKNWQEFSVYPLYSPMSLVAEGSANYGILMAFTPQERLDFERGVLYPLAGLDPALAETYAALTQLFGKLAYADNDAARAYLDGKATRAQTVEWLVNVLLYPPEKAEQRIRFYDANRGYVINYTVGADLVGEYVKRHATSADPETARAQRWTAFRQLLSSPRLADSLR
ncbi:hypothetical protein [Pseudoduganella aquatica]|uniref:DUF885 family protein n=1 Tax=Pseudoduganella aquatica TaxID=2660641 RepID=A0A7X4HGS1_9BURK|nr:hypothetical protein [Pseudoduganella aquatica]MYN09875.1 hypothetical protein [Pseudoduganella aquatica]